MKKNKTPNKNKATKKKSEEPKAKSNLQTIFIVFICIVIVFVGALAMYSNYYKQKVFPGVAIGGNDVSGMSFIETLDQVEKTVAEIDGGGLTFFYNDTKLVLSSRMSSAKDGISYEVYGFNSDVMVEDAYLVGREGNYLNQLKERLAALIFGRNILVDYSIDLDAISLFLKEKYSQFEEPHIDASLVVNEDSSFTITQEKAGQVFDYEKFAAKIKNNIENLQTGVIYLELEIDPVKVSRSQANILLEEAEMVAGLAPFNINFEDKAWEVSSELFRTWIEIVPVDDDVAKIGLDKKEVESFIDTLREEVEQPVQEGKFRMEGDRVVEFQTSAAGVVINLEKTIEKIEEDIIEYQGSQTALVVDKEEPEVTIGNVNDLGINELIGVGTSDFSGSPANRRSNIHLGADKLNGILIKPEEEFSLLKALGDFTAEEGWLPELVIKGNKTIPELGGGACQFGTTMFRAALDTGLPITNRRNHSYSVSYYYPIGTDATIYDPAPDFKFVNDTGHHVLIQTKIEGNIMSFEMWGTSDGRIIEKTDPVLSNWVSPPPTRYVDTTDLAPGQEKCTEAAHTGVTASFDYKVTYKDQSINEQNFTSKYKPWQKVCLRGVEEIKEETEE